MSGGAHDGEARKVDTRRGERGRVRQVRRRQPDDALAGPGQPGERRQHELQFADAVPGAEDLAQPAGRPAAARQLAIERGKAAGNGCNGALHGAGQRAAAPDGVPLQDLFQAGHSCIYIQYRQAWQGRTAHARRADLHMAGEHNRPVPMLRCAALLLAILFGAPAAAAEPEEPGLQVWINPGMFSRHTKQDRDYREDNYGLGIDVFFTPRHGVLAGSFLNSNDERSHYLGYHWRPLQLPIGRLRLSAGLAFALIDGYSDVRDGKAFPIMLPALSTEYRRIGAHLIFIPHPKHASAIALQVRLRVW